MTNKQLSFALGLTGSVAGLYASRARDLRNASNQVITDTGSDSGFVA